MMAAALGTIMDSLDGIQEEEQVINVWEWSQ